VDSQGVDFSALLRHDHFHLAEPVLNEMIKCEALLGQQRLQNRLQEEVSVHYDHSVNQRNSLRVEYRT
jgi:hypothetical protein